MNKRTRQARQILDTPGAISQFGRGQFKVFSLTAPEKFYIVKRTGNGMVCECIDHTKVGSDCCHIKAALMFTCRNMGYNDESFRIMDRSKRGVCMSCDSGNFIKFGTTKNNVQKFSCNECGVQYTANFGFGRMRFSQEVVTQAIQMRFSKMSTRKIADFLSMFGTKVSHVSVHKWTTKFSQMMADYLNDVVPRFDDRPLIRADEIYTKFSGIMYYIFISMDDTTRFMIATEVADSKYQHDTDEFMRETRRKIGRAPANLITDGLDAYGISARRVLPETEHISDIALTSSRLNRYGNPTHARYHPNNNKMERLNGEFRDWEKCYRGLKNAHSPLIKGFSTYFNMVKPHSALDGKTPGEAAKIFIEGNNKWITLI